MKVSWNNGGSFQHWSAKGAQDVFSENYCPARGVFDLGPPSDHPGPAWQKDAISRHVGFDNLCISDGKSGVLSLCLFSLMRVHVDFEL